MLSQESSESARTMQKILSGLESVQNEIRNVKVSLKEITKRSSVGASDKIMLVRFKFVAQIFPC